MGEWVCTYVRVLAYLQLTVPLFCTQTLRDCLQRVTEQVGSGEGEGTDSSEGAEGRREGKSCQDTGHAGHHHGMFSAHPVSD